MAGRPGRGLARCIMTREWVDKGHEWSETERGYEVAKYRDLRRKVFFPPDIQGVEVCRCVQVQLQLPFFDVVLGLL